VATGRSLRRAALELDPFMHYLRDEAQPAPGRYVNTPPTLRTGIQFSALIAHVTDAAPSD
jgi:hypothetical protein